VRARTGARRNAARGSAERLGLQMWSDALAGFDHASLASELASNLRWLLSCRLALATSTPPHDAFRRAPPYGNFSNSAGASVCLRVHGQVDYVFSDLDVDVW
jgi:hypothetical protein